MAPSSTAAPTTAMAPPANTTPAPTAALGPSAGAFSAGAASSGLSTAADGSSPPSGAITEPDKASCLYFLTKIQPTNYDMQVLAMGKSRGARANLLEKIRTEQGRGLVVMCGVV